MHFNLIRLKRMARKQTVILTHHGRKTGKPYQVTIWFALGGDKLYIGGPVPNLPCRTRTRYGCHLAEILLFHPILELGRILTAIGLMRDHTGAFEVTLASYC